MTSADPLLLPVGSRLVHIGPHKTGSTAIQSALHDVRDRLAEYDVHYAGSRRRPRRAGWALGLGGRPAGSEQPPAHLWTQLVREVRESTADRVCISNEDFGRAKRPQVAQIVADFGPQVHVVAVTRRLDRYLPSQWQERVKAGETRPYDEWLRDVLADDPEWSWDRHNVWFSHDLGRLVPRWVEAVGADAFTLIVTDEADRTQLPRTFERLLGLPEGLLQPVPDRSNRSLSWAETELFRAVNAVAARRDWSPAQRRRYARHPILEGLAEAGRAPGPSGPPLPGWAVDRVRELGLKRAEQARSLGVRVVGDPASLLLPEPPPVGEPRDAAPPLPSETVAELLVRVASAALEGEGGEETPG
ncbi:MAG: hypothetical protein R2731_08970 [Nocardioides sp.]